jgi:PAS domain S-box-containing protein
MPENTPAHVWQLLWEYDPNGLIVVDKDLNVKLVNPAFCQMFNVVREDIIGQPAADILGDLEDFKEVWQKNQVIKGKEKIYPKQKIHAKRVIFPIKEENIIACIVVDITPEIQRKQEMIKLKAETLKKVNEVVDNQMKVVQEIASLLGETTGETKVSLLKIIEIIEIFERELV